MFENTNTWKSHQAFKDSNSGIHAGHLKTFIKHLEITSDVLEGQTLGITSSV